MKAVSIWMAIVYLSGAAPLFAADQNLDDALRLYQSMTPTQQAEVRQRAELVEKDLEKLTPQQRAKLVKQLQAVSGTIDMKNIDPAKLDPSKAKGLKDTEEDLDTYQEKYNEGKINNAAVKPH